MIAQGVASPVLGRLADRFSQRNVLLVSCCCHCLAITALLASVLLNLPLWMILASAICAGCSAVPVDGFIRTRWAAMIADDALRTAYALETVIDEVIFLLGPLIAIVLSTTFHPAVGLVFCAVLTLSGSVALVLHRQSEPVTVQKRDDKYESRAISMPWVRMLMISYAAVGIFLGSVDVMMIAFSQAQQTPALAGVLLSICAVGSLVGGLCYGAMNWSLQPSWLLLFTSAALCAGTIPLALTTTSVVMGISVFIAGISVAPVLISSSTLLGSLTPKGALSEGFAWLSSAGWLGFSVGVSVGGKLSDLGGFSQAAWMAVGGGAIALLASVIGRTYLHKRLIP
ncbi:MFS transporter [Xenorhabdus hominickii]|nr:MFS transporter [Xenorhabdus hominickii]